ncbi:hypothetical protein B0H19DRAFT_1274171 [Mycena capillaripes]|nr:hypothetical protein B0H19DRAFT_1274171 [Mycena capillaripes]
MPVTGRHGDGERPAYADASTAPLSTFDQVSYPGILFILLSYDLNSLHFLLLFQKLTSTSSSSPPLSSFRLSGDVGQTHLVQWGELQWLGHRRQQRSHDWRMYLLTNGGSAKSIGYSGVPNQIDFFGSGGAHDVCSNGATLVLGGGSGCGTAPAGFNFESVSLS